MDCAGAGLECSLLRQARRGIFCTRYNKSGGDLHRVQKKFWACFADEPYEHDYDRTTPR